MNRELRFIHGLTAGIPIFVGYLPAAVAFGLLAKTTDVGLIDTLLFSLLVFAGASQFMALNLLQGGVAAGEIIMATLLLNLRHLLMSASLAARFDRDKETNHKGFFPLAAFGVTDETFSVAATTEGRISIPFMLGLEGISYGAWVGGTGLGYLLGAALPPALQESMGITLYAMFVAILVPEFRKSYRFAVLALGSGGVHILLRKVRALPAGWKIIGAILITAALGTMIFKDDD